MFDNFLDVRNIMREDGKAKTHKAVEILPVSTRGIEPREFKKQELKELMVLIFMNYISKGFKKDLHPYSKGLGLFFGVDESLSVDCVVVLFGIAL